MATTIRPELSEKNKYWISKHRYYELKHFCLQYPIWKGAYLAVNGSNRSASIIEYSSKNGSYGNPTERAAIVKAYYKDRMEMVEQAAIETDSSLYQYILKAVTEGLSYTYLRTRLDMPCSRDMYYDRYHKFFWVLSKHRN